MLFNNNDMYIYSTLPYHNTTFFALNENGYIKYTQIVSGLSHLLTTGKSEVIWEVREFLISR